MLSVLPALSAHHLSTPDSDVGQWPATNTQKTLTASIMENVPVDIWQTIFTESTLLENPIQFDEMFGDIWGKPTLGSMGTSRHIFVQQPAILSQVCRTWRHIAFGMPEIWSILFIKPRVPAGRETYSPPHVIDKLHNLINFRLSLANPMPLKICINARDSLEDARLLIRAIIPFSRRWKMVHLHVPSAALAEFLSLTSEDVPMLRSFKIYERVYQMGSWDATQMHDFDLFHIQKIAHSLRRLCTPFRMHSNLPFNNSLQELHLQQSPSESQWTLKVLESCPNLHTLTLTGYATTQGVLSETVTLPSLTTLNLEHPVGREPLLRALVTPLLRTLRLCGRGGVHARTLLTEFKDLMVRSEVASLESLHLLYETHNLNDAAISEFLAYNEDLKELKIDDTWMFLNGSMITTKLLKDITLSDVVQEYHDDNINHARSGEEVGTREGGVVNVPSPSSKSCHSSGRLIPALKRLSLIGCCGFSDPDLVTLIQSRTKGRHALDSVYLSMIQLSTAELDDAMRVARDEGVETKLLTIRGNWSTQW